MRKCIVQVLPQYTQIGEVFTNNQFNTKDFSLLCLGKEVEKSVLPMKITLPSRVWQSLTGRITKIQ